MTIIIFDYIIFPKPGSFTSVSSFLYEECAFCTWGKIF